MWKLRECRKTPKKSEKNINDCRKKNVKISLIIIHFSNNNLRTLKSHRHLLLAENNCTHLAECQASEAMHPYRPEGKSSSPGPSLWEKRCGLCKQGRYVSEVNPWGLNLTTLRKIHNLSFPIEVSYITMFSRVVRSSRVCVQFFHSLHRLSPSVSSFWRLYYSRCLQGDEVYDSRRSYQIIKPTMIIEVWLTTPASWNHLMNCNKKKTKLLHLSHYSKYPWTK